VNTGLRDKVVFITGAAQGIGRATARGFSLEGCKVAIADTNGEMGNRLASEIVSEGGKAVGIECDVSDASSVASAVQKIRDLFGTIHILVNNAGIGPPYLGKRIVEMPEEHWERMMSVHLKGAFLCTKYAAPLMIKQGWGRIVNLGSIHGISGGRPGLANYASAKAGVEGFTKAASLELAPFGVTVNCVAPGFTRTPMLKVSPEMEREMVHQTPVGKLAETDDIANAIIFLASEAAAHISGATIKVDGGRAVYFLEAK
jgi:3-oxoacyl-[acyl-carrier protein] reductase